MQTKRVNDFKKDPELKLTLCFFCLFVDLQFGAKRKILTAERA